MGYRTTRRQMTPMKPDQLTFLRALMNWQGVASPQDLGPQTTQGQNSARQTCKNRGWVTFDGYWRITDAGKLALKTAEGT